MTPSLFRRPSCAGPLLALLGAALVLALQPTLPGLHSEAAAQVQLAQHETRHQRVLSEYNALLRERDRAFNLYERALEDWQDARRAGDEARLEATWRTVMERSIQLEQMERRVDAAAEGLREARDALLQALDQREGEILDRLQETTTPVVRDALREELVRNTGLRRQVIPDEGMEERIRIRPVPELGVDPRDGPQELRVKAGLLESRAEEYDTVVVGLDEEIAALERRIQQARGHSDFLAGIGRFDVDRIPGGRLDPPEPPEEGREPGPDSLRVALADLPLPERVELLAAIRDLALEYRDRALAEARLFRERAEGRLR